MQSGGHAHTDGQGGGIVVESSRQEGTMFQTFWFGLFISSSLYSFSWDVYIGELIVAKRKPVEKLIYRWRDAESMYSRFIHRIILDWGLGRRDYGYLGPRLMFPKKSYYYMGEHWIDFAVAHSSTR